MPSIGPSGGTLPLAPGHTKWTCPHAGCRVYFVARPSDRVWLARCIREHEAKH